MKDKGFTICIKKNGKWIESKTIDEYCLESVLHSAEIDKCKDVAVMNNSDLKYEIYRKRNGKWIHSTSGNSDLGLVNICESAEKGSDELTEMLDKIYLRNTEKAFCESAQLNESPEVGLFWVDTKTAKVYGDGVPIRDGEMFGRGTKHQFVVHPSDHYSLWKHVKVLNQKWKNIADYEDVPRGRSVFAYEFNNNHFIVYMSPLLNNKKYEDAVRAYFSLPWNTEFRYDDPHYEPVNYD